MFRVIRLSNWGESQLNASVEMFDFFICFFLLELITLIVCHLLTEVNGGMKVIKVILSCMEGREHLFCSGIKL